VIHSSLALHECIVELQIDIKSIENNIQKHNNVTNYSGGAFGRLVCGSTGFRRLARDWSSAEAPSSRGLLVAAPMIETPAVGATDVGEGAAGLTGAVRRAAPRPTPTGAPRPTPRTAPPLAGPVGAGLRGKEPVFAVGAVGVGLGCEGPALDVETVSGGGFAAICTGGILLLGKFGAGVAAAAVLMIWGSWMPCASQSRIEASSSLTLF